MRKLEFAAMSAPTHPWTFLVVTVAGWIQREQQAAIDYLREENRVRLAKEKPALGILEDTGRALESRS